MHPLIYVLQQAINAVSLGSLYALVAVGLSMVFARGRTVFIADTSVNELPTPEQLADIAVQSAAAARRIGHEPRVALLSFSNFGNPLREKAERIRAAVAVLDQRKPDFEYEGEMQADVALDFELMRRLYPFSRLKGPANILVMPALHSANISAKLMQHGAPMRAVAFGHGDWVDELAQIDAPLDVAYRPVINDFRGRQSVEIQLVDWRIAAQPAVVSS